MVWTSRFNRHYHQPLQRVQRHQSGTEFNGSFFGTLLVQIMDPEAKGIGSAPIYRKRSTRSQHLIAERRLVLIPYPRVLAAIAQ